MRIHDILIFVMIAGILSTTIAEEQISILVEESLSKTSGIAKIIDVATKSWLITLQEYLEYRTREKCERNGGPTAVDDYKNAPEVFVNCVESLVNITQFEAEMAAARGNGEEDAIIENYCRKFPTFKNCLINVMNSIEPCLDLEERESVKNFYEITSSLLQSACENGDPVKDFIASGGTECLASKYPAVQGCSTRTFPRPAPDAIMIPGLGILPKLSLDLRGCMDIREYQYCSVKLLETCNSSTPATVVNNLFNFVEDTFCEVSLDPQVAELREEDDPQRRSTNSN